MTDDPVVSHLRSLDPKYQITVQGPHDFEAGMTMTIFAPKYKLSTLLYRWIFRISISRDQQCKILQVKDGHTLVVDREIY